MIQIGLVTVVQQLVRLDIRAGTNVRDPGYQARVVATLRDDLELDDEATNHVRTLTSAAVNSLLSEE